MAECNKNKHRVRKKPTEFCQQIKGTTAANVHFMEALLDELY